VAYISSELTHFVGRSLGSDKDRYDLLCKIVREGVLMDPSHVGQRNSVFRVVGRPVAGETVTDDLIYISDPSVRHDIEAKLSDNSLLQFEVVCFCDIPLDNLGIHCFKYGCFGLAFSKPFLVAQGASPVMYIPKPGSFAMTLREVRSLSGEVLYEESKSGSRAQIVDEVYNFHNFGLLYARYKALEDQFFGSKSTNDVDEVVRKLRTSLMYQTALEAFIFGYLKSFDPTLPPEHVHNYYMEREWRVAGKVRFKPADIQRIYVSEEFIDRARAELPEVGASQITTIPTHTGGQQPFSGTPEPGGKTQDKMEKRLESVGHEHVIFNYDAAGVALNVVPFSKARHIPRVGERLYLPSTGEQGGGYYEVEKVVYTYHNDEDDPYGLGAVQLARVNVHLKKVEPVREQQASR